MILFFHRYFFSPIMIAIIFFNRLHRIASPKQKQSLKTTKTATDDFSLCDRCLYIQHRTWFSFRKMFAPISFSPSTSDGYFVYFGWSFPRPCLVPLALNDSKIASIIEICCEFSNVISFSLCFHHRSGF